MTIHWFIQDYQKERSFVHASNPYYDTTLCGLALEGDIDWESGKKVKDRINCLRCIEIIEYCKSIKSLELDTKKLKKVNSLKILAKKDKQMKTEFKLNVSLTYALGKNGKAIARIIGKAPERIPHVVITLRNEKNTLADIWIKDGDLKVFAINILKALGQFSNN